MSRFHYEVAESFISEVETHSSEPDLSMSDSELPKTSEGQPPKCMVDGERVSDSSHSSPMSLNETRISISEGPTIEYLSRPIARTPLTCERSVLLPNFDLEDGDDD